MGSSSPGATVRTTRRVHRLVISCALLVRSMLSLWPYSGQGAEPMYGDYEAQRHWMEITVALPLSKWYRYDLQYWGLDYPPLTAYVSWVCGQLAKVVEPASMTLDLSRGYETAGHKAFMRLTVLLLDFVVFFPAAAALVNRLDVSSDVDKSSGKRAKGTALAMVLLQPSLLAIDHGHFQYNSVCVGLAMAGAAAATSGQRRDEFLGSFLFSLALNFKQTALYYAPAFFFYLLASCCRGTAVRHTAEARNQDRPGMELAKRMARTLSLGGVVLVTFAVLWAPFCIFAAKDDGGGCIPSLRQVLLRLFPFSRGLFEDKVANLWFCLDVALKLRRRLRVQYLAKLALLTTLRLIMTALELLESPSVSFFGSIISCQRRKGSEFLRPGRPLTPRRLILALFNSSMAFFLCSFQVHEKSLLLPLCPLAFLWQDAPFIVTWLQVVGIFSMTPLLGREGLLVPCVTCTMLYVGASAVLGHSEATITTAQRPRTMFPYSRFITERRMRVFCALSAGGMVLLGALEAIFSPPAALPHLFPTLNALYSCANLITAYALGVYWQWALRTDYADNDVDSKMSESKKAR